MGQNITEEILAKTNTTEGRIYILEIKWGRAVNIKVLARMLPLVAANVSLARSSLCLQYTIYYGDGHLKINPLFLQCNVHASLEFGFHIISLFIPM